MAQGAAAGLGLHVSGGAHRCAAGRRRCGARGTAGGGAEPALALHERPRCAPSLLLCTIPFVYSEPSTPLSV